jgi:voltage-gated potassium channel
VFRHFAKKFLHIVWFTKSIYLSLMVLIALGGFVISRVEGLSFFDAFYFAMITGLTIGYGDISAVTTVGRITAILLGFIGYIMTGLIVATAVFALRETIKKHRPDLFD